jgi:ADP-ribose pyrophosphatase YjhB (NUDIX family)
MENKILESFLYNKKLKFNEIEKILKTRSNKLAYHIKNLVKKGVLIKKDETYSLSDTATTLIPYLSSKKPVLPAILIGIRKKDKVFLINRKKRPFKDKLSLPGGRIIMGETISEATERIAKEKFKVNCKFKKINSISLEQAIKNKKPIHSFLLIFVEAKTKDSLEYTNIKKNKKKIITSDYKLITEDFNKKINIKDIETLV